MKTPTWITPVPPDRACLSIRLETINAFGDTYYRAEGRIVEFDPADPGNTLRTHTVDWIGTPASALYVNGLRVRALGNPGKPRWYADRIVFERELDTEDIAKAADALSAIDRKLRRLYDEFGPCTFSQRVVRLCRSLKITNVMIHTEKTDPHNRPPSSPVSAASSIDFYLSERAKTSEPETINA